MKFLFFPENCIPFNQNTLNERPLGGTETALIHLSESLAGLGHEVHIVSSIQGDEKGNPRYWLAQDVWKLGQVDVCILLRNWQSYLKYPLRYKKLFYWASDDYDVIHNYGIGDERVIHDLAGLLCVSQWQALRLCRSSGFPISKTWILKNGVKLADFSGEEKRHPKRLIFTSHPTRGLEYLHFIFLNLKEKHPELELQVFSASTTHSKTSKENPEEEILKKMRMLPDCYVQGGILQKNLARELMKSSVWTYPTHFEETSCISAMEAMAAGCAVITSAIGALPETIGNAGILIHEKPGIEQYIFKYMQALDRVLSDEALWDALSAKSLQKAAEFDWILRAKALLEYLETH